MEPTTSSLHVLEHPGDCQMPALPAYCPNPVSKLGQELRKLLLTDRWEPLLQLLTTKLLKDRGARQSLHPFDTYKWTQ